MRQPLVFVATERAPIASLGPAVRAAADCGYDRVAIDIDALQTFADSDVNALIRLLRSVRERGVDLTLHVARPERRRSLREMGLDRVFTMSPRHLEPLEGRPMSP